MIQLINTIEINLFKYSDEDFEFPEFSDYLNHEEWFVKMMEVASQLNINVNTIQKGSFLVDIETIDDETLQVLVNQKLGEIDADDSEEDLCVLSFDGGVVFKNNNEFLIEPNCCSDLSNIQEWQAIFENETSEWKDIWIGHPWILYKRENGIISFSDYTEECTIVPENITIKFEIPEAVLTKELEKVKQHQINFNNRILNILEKENINNAEKISKFISGIK
ncbi:hypothetical protein [Chryseobacterium artocarpi]|nr:hypothetical protein [Chryseobacterium artocarpi]